MSAYDDLAGLVTFRPISNITDRVDGDVRSPFSAPWSHTVSLLSSELWQIDAEGVVLELDLREQDLRLDGMPRANARMGVSGVVLYVGQSTAYIRRMPSHRFTHWQDNVRAIALSLEALRKVGRYGTTPNGEQYAGFRALESGSGPSAARGRTLIAQHGGVTAALRATHPDHGGDPQDFGDVQAAREDGA